MNKMTSSGEIDKVIRLIDYHIKLAQLRSITIRDIDHYEKVIWINDIPHLKGCFTQAWGRNDDYSRDIWIEVKGRKEPPLPSIPPPCRDWVDFENIRNIKEIPELKTEVVIIDPNGVKAENGISYNTLYLSDNPEIEALWNSYLETLWFPWSDQYQEWLKTNRIYTALFEIHQEQIRLGEEYELIVGIGLLTWKTGVGHRIRRHLVAGNAILDFEARLAKFTIRANIDGASLRPETDMLDLEELPPKSEETFFKDLMMADDDPWEKAPVENSLKAFVNKLHSQGEYIDSLAFDSNRNTERPVVEFAPAIILRKRTTKGLTNTLNRIKSNIKQNLDIPYQLKDLAEIDSRDLEKSNDDLGNHSIIIDNNHDVYFPKPSNDEQRRIIQKIRNSSGVLVQGPPGTGKSHTIANLICHLLATGQRILVTAKTPRALYVLEKQIPEELRPLCINLLGYGLDELRSMESSVGGILRQYDTWDKNKATEESKNLESKLDKLRKEKAVLDKQIRNIREAETYTISIPDSLYHGTYSQIAHRLDSQKPMYDWFIDKIDYDQIYTIQQAELLNIVQQMREFSGYPSDNFTSVFPENVVLPDDISILFSQENKSIEQERLHLEQANMSLINRLQSLDESYIKDVLKQLIQYSKSLLSIKTYQQMWVKKVIEDIMCGNDFLWVERYKKTSTTLTRIVEHIDYAEKTCIVSKEQIDDNILLQHAEGLKEYLKKEGKLGLTLFLPNHIKEHVKVLKNTRVNTNPCLTIEVCDQLIKTLFVRISLNDVWRYWSGIVEKINGPYSMQFVALKEICDIYEKLQVHLDSLKKCRVSFSSHIIFDEPNWFSTMSLVEYISSLETAICQRDKEKTALKLEDINTELGNVIRTQNSHPIVLQLMQSINERNVEKYSLLYQKTIEFINQQIKYRYMMTCIDEFRSVLPNTMKKIIDTYLEPVWDDRLVYLHDAWNWARAKSYLNEYLNKDDVHSIAKRLKVVEEDINTIIAELASVKAWTFCFERLEAPHQRHMESWQQSMRKLGKGTGKHANHHRREAQLHLNACRDAVPAWIMPLHRIWDTVDPASGIFDVIIIDEASQCGYEALPLYYLGKKILIVGDDKQISPDAVGISRDIVYQLQNDYLYDFEYRTSFDIESSLFDHAKIRFGKQCITLTEHFRCMPEIIQFSNQLCYSDTPLIPLRQYGPDRLPPLENVYVAEGYKEGSGSRVINKPEAETITERIIQMCNDPKYKEKTIGVVVLQGEAQGTLIENMLLTALGAEEFEKRKIVCGNPYSFQGDERHIIFLSMVAAGDRIGAFTSGADERRFNVAASRAKDQMILVHSVKPEDLSVLCLRNRLLEFFENKDINIVQRNLLEKLEKACHQANRGIEKPPVPFDSWFEVDVALLLLRKGYDLIPQHEVANKRIDLVIEGGCARLAVECDGDYWHGPEAYEHDMHRRRILERCGWTFYNIRGSAFYLDKDKELQKLWVLLENLGIYPYWASRISNNHVSDPKTNDSEVYDNEFQENDDVDDEINDLPDIKDELYLGAQLSIFSGNSDNSLESSYEVVKSSGMKLEEVTKNAIHKSIINTLTNCPNQTCTVDSLATRVLKELGIITRGKPRLIFEKRVIQILDSMDRDGIVEKYRAKNKRVRLVVPEIKRAVNCNPLNKIALDIMNNIHNMESSLSEDNKERLEKNLNRKIDKQVKGDNGRRSSKEPPLLRMKDIKRKKS